MSNEEAQEYLADMSDSDLVAALDVAKTDLTQAAATQPESEWHQSCFAGVLMFCMEMQKRGINVATVH